jgi:nitronate monooxygenase
MVQGLIADIPGAGEVIERIVDEAEEIIAGRLAGLLSGGAGRLSETATSVS